MEKNGIKVMIAMDDNGHSDQLFQWYLKNLHKEDNYVIIVHAADHGGLVIPPIPFAGASMLPEFDREEPEIERFVQQCKQKLIEAGVKGDAVRISDITIPGRAIVNASKEHKADVILLDNHSHGFWHKMFKVDVNKYVLKHSDITVISVR